MSKERKKVAQSAEVKEPDTKPESATPSDLAVQKQSEQTPIPESVPKESPISIVDIIKAIPDEKAEMAEQLGLPIKSILRWAYVMEESVKAQGKALNELGVSLAPVVDLAVKIKNTTQGTNPQAAQGNMGGIQMLMQLLGQSGSMGNQGGMSAGDLYFMEMGKEMASLGSFMAKEMFKKAIPEAFAAWEKTPKA
jgi:hypothetical protein